MFLIQFAMLINDFCIFNFLDILYLLDLFIILQKRGVIFYVFAKMVRILYYVILDVYFTVIQYNFFNVILWLTKHNLCMQLDYYILIN